MKKFKEKQKEKVRLFLMLLVISVLFFSCFNIDKKSQNEKKLATNNVITQKKQKDTILSYEPYNNSKECRRWKAPFKDSIIAYLKDLDFFDLYTWNQCFGNFECGVKGKLIYNDSIYNYDLNAGGWIKLSNKKIVKILGSKNKKDTISKFISIYYCDEDWD